MHSSSHTRTYNTRPISKEASHFNKPQRPKSVSNQNLFKSQLNKEVIVGDYFHIAPTGNHKRFYLLFNGPGMNCGGPCARVQGLENGINTVHWFFCRSVQRYVCQTHQEIIVHRDGRFYNRQNWYRAAITAGRAGKPVARRDGYSSSYSLLHACLA